MSWRRAAAASQGDPDAPSSPEVLRSTKFGLTLVKTDIYLTGELLSNSNLFFPAQFAIEKTKQSLSKPELNG